jgi:hypothetical protein
MSTPLNRLPDAILDASERARVETVISLYEVGAFSAVEDWQNKKYDVVRYILEVLQMDKKAIEYWLNKYGVI